MEKILYAYSFLTAIVRWNPLSAHYFATQEIKPLGQQAKRVETTFSIQLLLFVILLIGLLRHKIRISTQIPV